MFKPVCKVLSLLFCWLCATNAIAQESAISCAAPEGSAQLWELDSNKIIIVGENHGTAEIPAAFAELVCAAAARGEHVLVGLEYQEAQGAAFSTYLESAGTSADQKAFYGDGGWAMASGDGRSSVATWAMIERLRELKAAGANIEIATFVRSISFNEGGSQTPYEQGLAASLEQAVSTVNPDRTLVLVGNLHSRKTRVEFPGNPPIDPMAMHLDNVVSLLALHTGGAAWNCLGAGDCGPHNSNPSFPRMLMATDGELPSPGVTLRDGIVDSYDGILVLGNISAAAPAVAP